MLQGCIEIKMRDGDGLSWVGARPFASLSMPPPRALTHTHTHTHTHTQAAGFATGV